MAAFLALLLLSLLPFLGCYIISFIIAKYYFFKNILGYGIVYLDCSNAIYCPNETTVKLTCKTTNCFLEWRIGNPPLEIDFSCANSVGTTEFHGANTVNLTARYQEGYALISDMNFEAVPSVNGQVVQCLDGVDGDSSFCSLIPMSKISLSLSNK